MGLPTPGAIREARTLDPMIKSHVLYQLSYNRILEQVTRIELASSAWKADILTIVLHLHCWDHCYVYFMSLIDTMLYWVHDNLWYALIESNYVCRFIRPVLNTVEDKAHAYPVLKNL